jgi:WD40 repeat protein
VTTSPAGHVAAGAEDGSVHLWSSRSSATGQLLGQQADSVEHLLWAGSEYLVSGAVDGSIAIWPLPRTASQSGGLGTADRYGASRLAPLVKFSSRQAPTGCLLHGLSATERSSHQFRSPDSCALPPRTAQTRSSPPPETAGWSTSLSWLACPTDGDGLAGRLHTCGGTGQR